jgi:hypothetical protein
MVPPRRFERLLQASKARVLPLDEGGMAPAAGVEPADIGFGGHAAPTRSPILAPTVGIEPTISCLTGSRVHRVRLVGMLVAVAGFEPAT